MNFITTIFGWPLGWIMFACYAVVQNYGVALILFTIITKAIMLPFSIKQQKSTMKMAAIKPKMDFLNKTYANNREKLSEETMKLYKEENYNPMSGCLLSLVQFPILFGMIDVIYKPISHILRPAGAATLIEQGTEIAKTVLGTGFNARAPQISIITAIQNSALVEKFSALGSEFISKVQNFDMVFLGIDLTRTPTYLPGDLEMSIYIPMLLIPILSGVTSFLISIQSKMYNRATMGSGGGMNAMLYTMPIFSLIFTFSVPAGVGIYWTISNVVMLVQSYLLHKKYNPEKYLETLRMQEEEEKEKARLERMAAARQQTYYQTQGQKKSAGKGAKKALPVVESTIVEAPAGDDAEAQALPPDPAQTARDKETTARIIADARRRMAEKYGDIYVEEDK